MMVLVGFAVGYVAGAQAGREGLARLVASWQEIQKSDEFAAFMETGRSLLTSGLRQAFEAGTDEVKNLVNRRMRAG